MHIHNKVHWLLLLMVFLVAMMLPVPAIAQESRFDLALTLNPFNYYPYTIIEADKDNKCYLEVRNTGNQAVNNIRLSADMPEGWSVKFTNDTINFLPTGRVQTVVVIIRTPEKINKKLYDITFIAEADEIRKANNVVVEVKGSRRIWLWVGTAIGVVVVAAFVFVFLRFGRK